MITNDHWLEQFFKGWSKEKLLEQKEMIIKFSGSLIELDMIEMELKRRGGEEVA